MTATSPPSKLVIVHKDCSDGFTAEYVAWTALGDTAEYASADFGDEPPPVAGRDVIILDFCYPPSVIRRIDQEAKSLLVLDHHKSQIPLVGNLQAELRPGNRIVLDVSRAGCRLAWDHFYPGISPPYLVDAVEDRDLLRWALPESEVFLAKLDTMERTIENWDNVARMAPETLRRFIREGAPMYAKLNALASDVARFAQPTRVSGIEGLAVSVPGQLSSYVGMLLAQRSRTYGICWSMLDANRIKLSIRSNNGMACQIAERLGGGGHDNSAAARLPLKMLPSFLAGQL
jgi:uncharacterized protein